MSQLPLGGKQPSVNCNESSVKACVSQSLTERAEFFVVAHLSRESTDRGHWKAIEVESRLKVYYCSLIGLR